MCVASSHDGSATFGLPRLRIRNSFVQYVICFVKNAFLDGEILLCGWGELVFPVYLEPSKDMSKV